MIEPKPELIAQAAELALAQILPGAGYYNNCSAAVYRVRTPVTEWASFPALFVEIGDEAGDGGCLGGGGFQSKVDLIVFGYVKNEDPRAQLFRLLADVRRAILTGRTLGGVADDTVFDGFATDVGILAAESLAEFAIRFVVTYRWKVTEQ